MMFSIIIPVYNAAKYLSECLDSIVHQDCGDWEAICVDDGSTDSSPDILAEYARRDTRIKILRQENMGPSAARNRGIEASVGEWVSFVDSDDIVSKDYLSSFLKIKEKADMNFFSVRIGYVDGSVKQVMVDSRGVITRQSDFGRWFNLMAWNKAGVHYVGYTVNKFFRGKLLRDEKMRFRQGLSLCEDEIFTLSFAQHVKSIRVDPIAPYFYRWSESGLSTSRCVKGLYEASVEYMRLGVESGVLWIKEFCIRRAFECGLAAVRSERSVRRGVAVYRMLKPYIKHCRNRPGRLIHALRWLPASWVGIFFYGLECHGHGLSAPSEVGALS